jgi:glycine/D-amino acid oxidase-like deaminating enzyme
MALAYDALVVGAGYIGCAVASELAAAGLRTALLERAVPGAGGSGANYGSVQIQDCELDASVPFTVAGASCFPSLEEELGAQVGYRKRGSLLVIENEAQWQVMAARLPALHRAGIPAELVPGERLGEIEPLLSPRFALGACYYPGEGQVRPFQIMQAYLRKGSRHGLELYRETEVTGFEVQGGRLTGVQTNREAFSAPVTVLTTGAWTTRLGRLLGYDWGISHVHGQALVTERSEHSLRNHLSSAAFFESMHDEAPGGPAEPAPAKAAPAKAVLAVGQSHEGHFLLGEAGITTEDLGNRATLGGQAAIAAEINRFFPSLARLKVVRGWAAPVAYTADGRPYLGPVPGVEGLILATAFKSTVIVTPLTGKLVTQLVTSGETDLDLSAFSPGRRI